jgi:hypothetical protein
VCCACAAADVDYFDDDFVFEFVDGVAAAGWCGAWFVAEAVGEQAREAGGGGAGRGVFEGWVGFAGGDAAGGREREGQAGVEGFWWGADGFESDV